MARIIAVLIGLTLLAALPHASVPAGNGADVPARVWRATLTESDGVEIVVYLTLRFRTSTTWELYSREDAARSQVSWFKWMLGGLVGTRPPHGAILAVTNGAAIVEGEGLALRGELQSPFLGRRFFVGRLQGERWHAELRRGDATGEVRGRIDAVPAATQPAVRNYSSLAADVRKALTDSIYDPSLLQQPRYRRFLHEIDTAFGRARDDLDAVVSFEAARARLGVSHLRLIRNPKLAATPQETAIDGDPNVNPDDFVRLNFSAPGVAYLRISRWDRVSASVGRAFERIAAARATTLILDIRGNRGGDATSMSPAAYLLDQRLAAGVILSRKWYATHRQPPTAAELSLLPVATLQTSAREMFRHIEDDGAIVGWVEPRTPRFTGEVFLVTDRQTGSASEPLVHLLKATGRATVVGEATAGSVLLALPQPLSAGFVILIPRADYYMADGTRLEGRGVQPHVKRPSADALVAVAERLRKTRPYPGTLLLGGVYRSLRRWDEAERAYRSALAIAPTDADRAVVQRQLDAMAIERVKS